MKCRHQHSFKLSKQLPKIKKKFGVRKAHVELLPYLAVFRLSLWLAAGQGFLPGVQSVSRFASAPPLEGAYSPPAFQRGIWAGSPVG